MRRAIIDNKSKKERVGGIQKTHSTNTTRAVRKIAKTCHRDCGGGYSSGMYTD